MAKYEVDISAWLAVEAESEDEAFAIGHQVIAELHDRSKSEGGKIAFDGEVNSVSEWVD